VRHYEDNRDDRLLEIDAKGHNGLEIHAKARKSTQKGGLQWKSAQKDAKGRIGPIGE
jgi:hypothetical protein